MRRPPPPASPGPRPRPRPSWIEQQRRRRHSPLLHLIDHSFGVRLLLAVSLAALLLGAVNHWQVCRQHGFAGGCWQVDPGGIVNVGNVEALSIVSAAFLYLLEGGQRRRREHREAMEVVTACQASGVRLSLLRNEALEQLTASGVWLDGLDLREAHLEALEAPHARLRGADLRQACLRLACLHDSDLQHCNLAAADLRQADLRHADLRGANLEGADLRGADLAGADLAGARLAGALRDGGGSGGS